MSLAVISISILIDSSESTDPIGGILTTFPLTNSYLCVAQFVVDITPLAGTETSYILEYMVSVSSTLRKLIYDLTIEFDVFENSGKSILS